MDVDIVVGPPNLVLLNLYAGGPRDAWDVHQILGLADGAGVPATVESRLSVLPKDAIALWRRIAPSGRRSGNVGHGLVALRAGRIREPP